MSSFPCRVCQASIDSAAGACPHCGTVQEVTTDYGCCPPPGVLARRLEDALEAAEASVVDAHVECCAACQAVLNRLVAAPDLERTPPPSAGFLEELKRKPLISDAVELPTSLQGQAALSAVPGYEIVKELGRGGMGVVYLARQKRLGRLVALKMILSGGHAGESDLLRFRTEGEAVARLQHSNIVQVYEVGEQDGLPYFSLEYCSGGSLADRLAAGLPDFAQVARWAEDLARAVQVAHDARVLHRDLKPANVLIGADGSLKITDFGLAKKLDDVGQTQTGQVIGTPSYMSPEQAGGRKDVGPPADVWALGAVLYAMLTGQPPFKAATSFDTIMQVLRDDPIPPSRLRSGTPRDLETICLKCLQKEPAKRYADAANLANDLRRFLEGKPITARPVGPVERAWRSCRRNRGVASSLAALFLVLLAGVAVALYLATVADTEKVRADGKTELAEERRKQANKHAQESKANEKKARQEKGKAEAARRDAEKAKGKAEAKQRESEDRLIRLHIATGLRLVDEGDLLGALPWLAEALRREHDPRRAERHRVRFAAVLRLCPRLVGVWTNNVYEATPSPDGRHIAARAIGAGFTSLAMLDAFTGKELYPPLRMPLRTAVRFSPDGSRFLTIEDYLPRKVALQLRATLTGKPAGPALSLPVLEVNASFTSDGKRLLTIHLTNHNQRNLRLWDLATGKDVTPDNFRRHRPQMFMRAMDGDVIATVWNATDPATMTARTWTFSRGEPLGEPFKPARNPAEMPTRFSGAFAPDGSRLTLGQGKVAGVYEMTALGPQRLPFTLCTSEEITHSHMFLGGARLATITAAGTHWWDARTGKLLRTWRRGREGQQDVDFSDDGRLVLFHDKATDRGGARTRVWDWQADEPASPLLRHAAALAEGKFLPDARRLLTSHRTKGDLTRGDLLLWDLAPAPPLALDLRCWTDRLGRSCLSADGKRVVCEAPEGFVVRSTLDGKPVAPVIQGHPLGASFSDSGRHLLVTFEKPKRVQMYDLDRKRAGKPILIGYEKSNILDMLTDAAVSPDGTRAVLVRVAGRKVDDILKYRSPPATELWDTVNGKRITRLMPPIRGEKAVMVKNVGFSPDGKRIVAVVGEATRDETPGSGGLKLPGRFFVRVWDQNGRELPAPPLAGGMYQQNFHIYLLGQMARQQRFLAFSHDSKRMALSFGGARGLLAGLDPKGSKAELVHEGAVKLVAFSADGKLVLTASDDQTARLWDSSTGKPAGPPLNHGIPVKAAVFGPNDLVATIGGDGTVRVWDAATALPLTPLFRPPGAKRASLDTETVQAAFSADGGRLMLIANGRIWWHDLSPDTRPPAELRQLAELLAGRRIHPTGASLTPLSSADLRQRWDALTARRLDSPGAGRLRWKDLLAWHRQQARRAAADREWTAAAHHWGRLTRANAQDGEAWRGRGQAHLELGLHIQAGADFSRATKVNPKDALAWHLSGRALASLSRHKEAVAHFSRAIKLGRKAEVMEDRADSYAEQEKWAEAILDLTELTRASLKDKRGGVGGSTRLVYKTGLLYAALSTWKVPGLEKGYHSACLWFGHRFYKETTPAHAKHLAWICGWAPGEKGFHAALLVYPRAVGMPREGAFQMFRAVCEGARNMEFEMKDDLRLKGEPGLGGSAYSPLTANALLCLRLDKPDIVISLLTKEPPRLLARALKIEGKGDINALPAVTRQSLGLDGTPWNDLLLGIALAKRGRSAEAKKALAAAVKRIAGGKWPWPERLELRLLRAEAEAITAQGK